MASRHSRKEAFSKVRSTLPDKKATASPQQVSIIDEANYQDNRGILQLRGIEAGAGIDIRVEDADDRRFNTRETKLRISATGTGSGEANDGTNLGTGTGIYEGKSGVTLRFKSLKAGTGISITETATEITINATGGGGALNDVGNFELNIPSGGPYISVTVMNIYGAGVPAGADVYGVMLNGLDVREKLSTTENGWEFSTGSGNLVIGPLNYDIEDTDNLLIFYKV